MPLLVQYSLRAYDVQFPHLQVPHSGREIDTRE